MAGGGDFEVTQVQRPDESDEEFTKRVFEEAVKIINAGKKDSENNH